MSTSQPLPPKKEVALALLERSNDRGIFVHLDPRQATVVVPPWFKKQPQLVLQIGLNMAIPIPDLRFDDDGMSCTLSFNASPFFCSVPWAGVFAIVDESAKGMVWPDDVPPEIARQVQVRAVEAPRRDEPEAAAKGARPRRPRKRSALAAVEGDEAQAPRAPSGSPPAAAPPPAAEPPRPPPSQPGARVARPRRELPPYLRVVK